MLRGAAEDVKADEYDRQQHIEGEKKMNMN